MQKIKAHKISSQLKENIQKTENINAFTQGYPIFCFPVATLM